VPLTVHVKRPREGPTTFADTTAQPEARPRRGRRGDGWVYYRADCSKWWIGYHHEARLREPGGATEQEATRRLKARLKEIAGDRFVGPREEKVLVDALLDHLELHLANRGARSVRKVKSHLKPVRDFFGAMRAIDLSTHDCEVFTAEQLADGKPGPRSTGAGAAPPELPARGPHHSAAHHARPVHPMLKVENARQGFLSRADFEALVAAIPDADVRDFVEFGGGPGCARARSPS